MSPRLMRRLSSVMASDSLMSGRENSSAPEVSEDLLRARQDAAVILAAPGDVEQTKQHALRTDTDRVVEISSDALAHENCGDVDPVDLGKYGRDGFDRRCGIRHMGGKRERMRASPRGETSTGSRLWANEGGLDVGVPRCGLLAVLVGEVSGQVGLKLAVVGVDGGS